MTSIPAIYDDKSGLTLPTVAPKYHVLSQLCHEPEGDFERHVSLMPLSIQNLKTFWERSKMHRTLFNEEIKGDFREFLKVFISENAAGQISRRYAICILNIFDNSIPNSNTNSFYIGSRCVDYYISHSRVYKH